MINTINIDKDIMLYSIVDALGGGQINWRKREVSLLNDFLGKKGLDNPRINYCLHNEWQRCNV